MPTFYQMNLPMLETHRVIHKPDGREIPREAFEMAWNASTRVLRVLEHMDCFCERCNKRNILYFLVNKGFSQNISDYEVIVLESTSTV